MSFRFSIVIIFIFHFTFAFASQCVGKHAASEEAIKDAQKASQKALKEMEKHKGAAEQIKENAFKNAALATEQYKAAESNPKELSVYRTLKQADKGFFNDVQEKSIPNVLVFVSLSMPKQLLLEYAEEAEKLGAVLVIRGMYKNSLKNTFTYFKDLKEKGASAIIHPSLFKKFEIKQVPVIVLNDGHMPEKYTPIFDKMSGSVSIKYALNKFSEKGSQAKLAKELISNSGGSNVK